MEILHQLVTAVLEGSVRPTVRRFRIYTGPTCASETAARLRQAGFNVFCEGTEAVYVRTFRTRQDIAGALGLWRAGDIWELPE